MAGKAKDDLPAPASPPAPAPTKYELAARLSELEQLIRPPLLPSQLERADSLAVAIARNPPDAVVAMLATRLMRAIQEARAAGENTDIRPIALIVARMRAALDQPV